MLTATSNKQVSSFRNVKELNAYLATYHKNRPNHKDPKFLTNNEFIGFTDYDLTIQKVDGRTVSKDVVTYFYPNPL